MVESVANQELEPRKRRSTRIVQAVPLTVTGVDALGRPFQERTSTMFINCHGCRYQSKHYVLKNMWVTLEVPHPETGREPRSVRGRVTWIQRPRTVRELFQIGVELEVPGNVWGIAFPPEDWFAFPEGGAPEIPAPGTEPVETPVEDWIGGTLPPVEPAVREDNLRVLPGPGGADANLQLARQVARLVVEAKQTLQTTVREAASSAVDAEIRPLLAKVTAQLQEAAERTVQTAAASEVHAALERAEARLEAARESSAASLRETWTHELKLSLEESSRQFAAQLAELAEAQRAKLDQHVQEQVRQAQEDITRLGGELGARSTTAEVNVRRVNEQIDAAAQEALLHFEHSLGVKAEEARSRLEKLEHTARKLTDEINAATTAAQSGWRARLDADVGAANARWNERVESSLESAAREAADRLSRNAQAATSRLEQDLTTRTAALRQSLEQATAESESILGTLRTAISKESTKAKASLADLQQATAKVEEHARQLETTSQATLAELDRRFQSLLEAQSSELNRRAESAVAGMAARLQPAMEAAGSETLARLASQLEERITPHLTRANDLLEKLHSGQAGAEAALLAHEERVREVSDRAVHETVERIQSALGRFEADFQEAGRAATAKWLAELDAKATDTTHTTFEALFKSAEWYEKKVQTQMQAALEKGLEQASNGLREKAGEISGLFASELDHYSRSYVEHTEEQLEEATKDVVERGRALMAQAAETTTAALADEMRKSAQREFERFTGSLAGTVEQTESRLETHAAQVRSRMDAEARQFFVDFHKGMSEVVGQGVAQARRQLEAEIAPVQDALRMAREAQERKFEDTVARLSDDEVADYKSRLENVSNTWLLATVTKLTQQSQGVIDSLAETAEKRLRESCSQVFAAAGDALRQRLLEISSGLNSPPPDNK